MDEQKQPQETEPERLEESVEDLEPKAEDADTVKGGGTDIYIQIKGESQAD